MAKADENVVLTLLKLVFYIRLAFTFLELSTYGVQNKNRGFATVLPSISINN